jgi:hypothetical protein
MQTEAIPFTLTPGSFIITCLLLIIVVYASRLVGRHFWRHLQWGTRTAFLWIKIGDVGKRPPGVERQGGIPLTIQEHFGRLKVVEESHGIAASQAGGGSLRDRTSRGAVQASEKKKEFDLKSPQ